jgi:hypothetical protein
MTAAVPPPPRWGREGGGGCTHARTAARTHAQTHARTHARAYAASSRGQSSSCASRSWTAWWAGRRACRWCRWCCLFRGLGVQAAAVVRGRLCRCHDGALPSSCRKVLPALSPSDVRTPTCPRPWTAHPHTHAKCASAKPSIRAPTRSTAEHQPPQPPGIPTAL